jgi:hypothetical protein
MNEAVSMWDALDADWLYLGRPLAGITDVAALAREGERFVPLFLSEAAARPFQARARPGLALLEVAAADLRAKEEWLRAALEQGALTVAVDPDPLTLAPRTEFQIERGLWYVLSHKRDTACL